MKTLAFSACLLGILFTACTSNSVAPDSTEIDLVKGLDNLTTLKTSDFGKTIRYVPLETTDDCLVGNNPTIKVLKDKIVVTTSNQSLVFNKSDGKFISSVGHKGDDPEGYSSTMSWADDKNGILYFTRKPNQLQKYNLDGSYAGKIELPKSPGLPGYMLVTQSGIIANFTEFSHGKGLGFFDFQGNMNDSLPALIPNAMGDTKDVTSITVLKNISLYGNWTKSGLILIDMKDGKKLTFSPNSEVLWENKGNVRYKEPFNDTIYTIKNNNLEPYIAFHTGSYFWPAEEITSTENSEKRMIIPYATENDGTLFFQCIMGLHSDNSTLYNGIYNKETGVSKLAKYKDGIEDDLSSFMPFQPQLIGTSGEYAGIIEASKALEWAEEHPDNLEQPQLKFLKELNDDMNPVIVLVEP